jgi:hypothetical protein
MATQSNSGVCPTCGLFYGGDFCRRCVASLDSSGSLTATDANAFLAQEAAAIESTREILVVSDEYLATQQLAIDARQAALAVERATVARQRAELVARERAFDVLRSSIAHSLLGTAIANKNSFIREDSLLMALKPKPKPKAAKR